MAVTIRLVNVEIHRGVPPGAGSPNDDGASVHLEIAGDNATVTLSYLIRPFRSLDEAVEEARKRLLAFAQDLASQANNPLIRTPGSP
jgi:hypothetical protein